MWCSETNCRDLSQCVLPRADGYPFNSACFNYEEVFCNARCVIASKSYRKERSSKPAHRQNIDTSSSAASAASANAYMCLYMYIVLYYTSVHKYRSKKCLCQVREINTLITCCCLWHCTKHLAHTSIFWKSVFSNLGVSTEAARGWGPVSHFLLAALLACFSFIFCKFIMSASRFVVGALHPLAPHWLQPW